MAGNRRGKLKEEVEGLHRNFDWARVHSQKAKVILGESHPELHEMFDNIILAMNTMDEIAANIYSLL
jgi:hypothetical protein